MGCNLSERLNLSDRLLYLFICNLDILLGALLRHPVTQKAILLSVFTALLRHPVTQKTIFYQCLQWPSYILPAKPRDRMFLIQRLRPRTCNGSDLYS